MAHKLGKIGPFMAQKIPMHFSTWEKENKEMKYTVDTL